MSDSTIQLLKDLIAIDSVNPSLVPGGAGEGEIAKRLADEMRSFGMDAVISEAAPGRPNVIGVLEGRTKGKSLMLCGHSDTVGIEGMAAPFDPVEHDGKIFGRGAQDMKGGVASILGAARKLSQTNAIRAGHLVNHAAAAEAQCVGRFEMNKISRSEAGRYRNLDAWLFSCIPLAFLGLALPSVLPSSEISISQKRSRCHFSAIGGPP